MTEYLTKMTKDKYVWMTYQADSMQSRISETYRSLVIQKWLEGLSRDLIAKECGLSAGTVSAIIVQWRHLVGIEYADQLRELAVALRKGGFSALDLAGAIRLKNIMNQIGVGEEPLREFLTETYNTCKEIGLKPYQIAAYLRDLVAFGTSDRRRITKNELASPGERDSIEAGQIRGEKEDEDNEEEQAEGEEELYGTIMVPLFSQLPGYMAKLKDEKNRLEDNIKKLRKDKNLLNSQYASLERGRDEMLKKYNMVEEQLKWYVETRTELRKFGLSVDDVPKFVKSVRWIQDAGYSVAAIITNFSNYADLQHESNELEIDVVKKKKIKEDLQRTIASLEELAQKHRLKDAESEDLRKMGFGFKEFKRLRHTIEEIYEANNENNVLVVGNSPDAANTYVVSKFLNDIEAHYDDFLGFQKSVDQLKGQIQNLTAVRKQQQQAISAIPHIGTTVTSLLRKGVTEDEILNMLVHLEKDPGLIDSIFKSRIADSGGGWELRPIKMSADSTKSNDPSHFGFWYQYQADSCGQLHDNTGSVISPASEPEPEIKAQDSRLLDSSSLKITPLPVVNVSANSNEGKNFPANTIDGNFNTFWSNKGKGSWLLLDLGTTKNIRSVNIAWYQGEIYDYYYEISLSNDALNFKNVKKSCSGGQSSSFLEYNLKPGSEGRYIRIEVFGNNYDDMAGITEIQVTGSHLNAGNE